MSEGDDDLDDVFSDLLRRGSSLLIVDDQRAMLQTLYQIFKDEHEVFIANSGEQALTMCETRLPDLILLDMMMPGIGGFETCRRLKAAARTRHIPVIYVTGTQDQDDETRGLETGAVDFISKPVNPSVVRARVRTHLRLKAQSDLLRTLARSDALTGTANRRRFDETLPREWRRCARAESPLSLVFIDVDHFKLYNDHYGHQVGDACLKAVAGAMRDTLRRPGDLLARYGGEEFVCLLPDTPSEGAAGVAQELLGAVRALAIPHAYSQVATCVTISLGVATCKPADGGEPEDLVAAADQLLYEAKAGGRAQVKVGGPAVAAP